MPIHNLAIILLSQLFGDNNPGGKTPVTWYDESIEGRQMDNMDISSGDGLTHMYYTKTPLWPFGCVAPQFPVTWCTGTMTS